MKGTITWLEATEENVREIDEHSNENMRFYNGATQPVLVRYIDKLSGEVSHEVCSYYRKYFVWNLTDIKTKDVTHFTYINEPE